jgi:hypothetical protein
MNRQEIQELINQSLDEQLELIRHNYVHLHTFRRLIDELEECFSTIAQSEGSETVTNAAAYAHRILSDFKDQTYFPPVDDETNSETT